LATRRGFSTLQDITLDLAEDIARLAPFGNGNPPLTLVVRDVQVKSRRTLGRRGDHLDLRLEDASGHEQRVIWWSGDIDSVPEGKFDLAYTVRPNVYKGKREALIEWLDARSVDGGLLVLGAAKSVWDVIDYRTHPDPLALLNQVKNSHEDVLVWGEGIPGMEGLDRYHLYPAKTLVVRSIPPDPLIWHSALNIVQPQTLILFGQPSPFDQPESLLKYAGGLLKYAYRHKQGVVSASAIAGLTNQSEQTIRVCFKWFHTRSEMDLVPMSEDEYRIEMNSARMTERDKYSEQLKFLLNETIAYRQYWLKRSFQ
jgi:single-stranded-DNA-specific exonuclease